MPAQLSAASAIAGAVDAGKPTGLQSRGLDADWARCSAAPTPRLEVEIVRGALDAAALRLAEVDRVMSENGMMASLDSANAGVAEIVHRDPRVRRTHRG